MKSTYTDDVAFSSSDILTFDGKAVKIMLAVLTVSAAIVLFGPVEILQIKGVFFGGVMFVTGMFAAIMFPVTRVRRGFCLNVSAKRIQPDSK